MYGSLVNKLRHGKQSVRCKNVLICCVCILKRNKKNKYLCNFLGESTKATSTTGIPILDGASPEPMSSEQLLLSTRYWIILFKKMMIEISISRKKCGILKYIYFSVIKVSFVTGFFKKSFRTVIRYLF